MARRKRAKRGFNISRVFVSVAAILVLVAAGWFGYRHFDSLHAPIAAKIQPEPPPGKAAAPSRVTLSGQLSAAVPARDAQIGIGAHAAVLLRRVEMYEWIERCTGTAADSCKYEQGWAAPLDSSKFRLAEKAKGAHANPKPPFADARFVASEIKLDNVTVDPALIETQLKPVDLPIKPADLPPNMAATFTVRDGVLYAGGDPAHPEIGTVRISYRMVPTGPATLSGLQKGTHLTQ